MHRRKVQLNTHLLNRRIDERKKALRDVGVMIWNPEDLTVIKLIGAGSFGKAELASLNSNPEAKVVLKSCHNDNDEMFVTALTKEVQLLSTLNHPSIVSTLGVVAEPLALVLEYVAFDWNPYGTNKVVSNLTEFLRVLHDCGAVRDFQEEYDILNVIANQVASGLAFLHDNNIAHRDLKPSNILVGNIQDGEIDDEKIIECKLTDFGEARFHSVQMTSVLASSTAHVDRGTLPFQAPEVVLGTLTSATMSDLQKIDVWAFGCVLFCLLNPDIQFPFEEDYKSNTAIPKDFKRCIMSLLRDRRLPQTSAVYKDLRHQLPGVETVMKSCLSFDRSKRPTTMIILERLSSASQWDDTRGSGWGTHSATSDSNRTVPASYASMGYNPSHEYTDRSLGDGSVGEEYADDSNHANATAINQMTASFQTDFRIIEAPGYGTSTSTDTKHKESEARATPERITEVVPIAYHLTRYIEQLRETDLTRIGRLCNVKIKCKSSAKGHGILIKGLERDVSKASTEVALFAAELAGVIHEVQIDVSTLQHTTLDVTGIIQAIRQEYEYVVFDFSSQIIRIIGAKEHIDTAERYLRRKLFKTKPARQDTQAQPVLRPTQPAAEVVPLYDTLEEGFYRPPSTYKHRQLDSRGTSSLQFNPYASPLGPSYSQPPYSEYEPDYQTPGSRYYHPFTAPERRKENRYSATEEVLPVDDYQTLDSSFDVPFAAPVRENTRGYPATEFFSEADGGQPRGNMKAVVRDFQLDGCWNKGGTYEIKFNFPAGTCQGRRQSKTTHTAYVQATSMGEKVLKLLEQAFDDGVLFIMGPGGQITWNGVRLITSKRQKAWRGYLPAVIEALAALGVY